MSETNTRTGRNGAVMSVLAEHLLICVLTDTFHVSRWLKDKMQKKKKKEKKVKPNNHFLVPLDPLKESPSLCLPGPISALVGSSTWEQSFSPPTEATQSLSFICMKESFFMRLSNTETIPHDSLFFLIIWNTEINLGCHFKPGMGGKSHSVN